jgi:hypothetical protein
VLRLDEEERGVLMALIDQIAQLVAPEPTNPDADPLAALVGIDVTASRPDNPVVLRLFPDGYADDESASDEFRRYTERGLREIKSAHARTARATLERSGDKVTISSDEAQSWLGTLNDLRLALGTTLELTDEGHDEFEGLAADDPRAAGYHLYGWLTWLQDSLVNSLLEGVGG